MADFYKPELAAPKLPLVYGLIGHAGVLRLQEWLVVRGVSVVKDPRNAPGIDGDYGGGTKAGVEAFAAANALPAVVDDRFWLRLTSPMLAASSYRPMAKGLGEAIVEVAAAHLLQQPREARQLVGRFPVGVDNSGPWVRAYMDGNEGQPWCQGFARAIVRQAAAALGAPLPFPIDGPGIRPFWVPDIVDQARRAGRLLSGRQLGGTITPGSFFFVPGVIAGAWSHIHVGIVTAVLGGAVETIEGNTNTDGSANGWLVCRRERPIAGLDFGLI